MTAPQLVKKFYSRLFFFSLSLFSVFSGPASKLVLKFFIALWCASIGALFTFPGLRIAKMQWDLLKNTEHEGPGITKILLHAAFVSPLILTTLWIKPLSRDYLTERVYKGMSAPL